MTVARWAAIVSAYESCCAYCGGPYEHMEHVVPISRGGRTEPGNVVPSCRSCNSRKGTKTPAEWIGSSPSKSAPVIFTGALGG